MGTANNQVFMHRRTESLPGEKVIIKNLIGESSSLQPTARNVEIPQNAMKNMRKSATNTFAKGFLNLNAYYDQKRGKCSSSMSRSRDKGISKNLKEEIEKRALKKLCGDYADTAANKMISKKLNSMRRKVGDQLQEIKNS